MNITKFIPAIIGFVTLTVNAASFDCGKAGTNIEKQICANEQLSHLDEDLARKYKIMMASTDDGQKNALKKDQKIWLAQRNGCSNSACIEEAYSSRIKDLCQNTVLSRLDECRASDPGLAGERGRDSSSAFEATSPQFQKLNISANSENDREEGSPDENKSDERANRKDSNSSLFGNATRSMGNPARSQSPKGEKATGPEIREVVIDGYGKDVPSAAQNAAQNALTQVVGSFIDAQKMVEKQVEIRDGVRSQVKNVKTDIKEYSQGSIKSFEITRVGEDNGLTVVTAKVQVRIEELTTYVNSIVGGERQIAGPSLYAQAATKTQQNEDKFSILMDNVLKPLTGDVVRYDISEPKPYDNTEIKLGNSRASTEIKSMADKHGSENLWVFDVVANLDEDYIKYATKSLEGISRLTKKIRNIPNFDQRRWIQEEVSRNGITDDDFLVFINDSNSSIMYLIENTYSRLNRSSLSRSTAYNYGGGMDGINALNKNSYVIEFADLNGNIILEEVATIRSDRARALPTDYEDYNNYPAWNFIVPAPSINARIQRSAEADIINISTGGVNILKQRKFKLIIAIHQNILKKIEKMTLKLEDTH